MTKFRYDINALRALAVAAVVGYHYNVEFLPGGFAGVDIFFVISGYLMTAIISGRLEQNRFSLWQFYYDRARRIVPGLLGLIFVLFIVGWFLLDPIHYNTLSYTGVSAILFFSNIQFVQSQGYFSPDQNTKLLLHTWSLSVEWQFYMLYPIALMLLDKIAFARRHLTKILLGVIAASLALCVYWSTKDQPVAFYLLPQRAWEMAAGGVVALNFANRPAPKFWPALMAAGLALIAVALFCFTKNTPWPSWYALAPVLGTCLVIAAGQTAAPPFRFAAVQTLGKWSYSIYLWHWPIAVMAVYFNYTKTSAPLILVELAILAAIILTGAGVLWGAKTLWRHIDWSPSPPSMGAAALGGAFALVLAFALTADIYRGFPDRSPEMSREVQVYKMASTDWDFPGECDNLDAEGNLRPCHLGKADGPETLILGDSFAMQIYQRLEAEKDRLQGPFTFLLSSGCPPVTGVRQVLDPLHCTGYFDKAFPYAAQRNPRRLVLASNWFAYFHPDNEKICFIEGEACTMHLRDPDWFVPHVEATFAALRETLRKFRERGTEVVIVSATPYGKWNVPAELLKRQFLGLDTQEIAWFDRDQFERDEALVKRNLVALAEAIGATMVEPVDFLCEAHRCPTLDADGIPYYRDKGHFRAAAVRNARFDFFDRAVGVDRQYSAIAAP